MMLGKADIVAVLKREVAARRTTQEMIGKVIGVPQPVISRLLNGDRDLSCDEAKALVEHYRIAEPVTFSLDVLLAILTGMLKDLVPDHALEQELPVLAATLQHALRRISENPALADDLGTLTTAVHFSVARHDPPTP